MIAMIAISAVHLPTQKIVIGMYILPKNAYQLLGLHLSWTLSMPHGNAFI